MNAISGWNAAVKKVWAGKAGIYSATTYHGHCERSVAIQSPTARPVFVTLDCRVASLLAMTAT